MALSINDIPAPWNPVVHPHIDGLTVGIELELFLAHTSGPENSGHDGNKTVLPDQELLQSVCNSLREVFPAQCDVVLDDEPSKVAHSYHGYYKWTFEVKGEATLRYRNDESTLDHHYAWVPIEITTPAMKLHDVPPILNMTLEKAIKPVFIAGINSTAALHVHIGREDLGFPELTVKKLATILWLGEKRLDRLYAREPHTLFNSWARPFSATNIGSLGAFDSIDPLDPAGMSEKFRRWLKTPMDVAFLECGPGREHQMSDRILLFGIDVRLKYLWDAESLEKVCELLLCIDEPNSRGEFSAGYNFLNLIRNRVGTVGSEFPNPKRTVEFRKPAATLRVEVAAAWCHVFAELVGFAHRSNHLEFGDLVRKLFRVEAQYSMDDMLRDIGCDGGQVEILKNRSPETEAELQVAR
ncbi:hypothetical protein QBC44DRAFT_384094 [Cladorrhinum sp. PSN332]|nr:hypothetical protein QBC44DRAFT_384094 [Cladorrhinum sp. PSN332]